MQTDHNFHSSALLSKNWYHILYERMREQRLLYPTFSSNLHHKDYHHISMTITSFLHSYLSYCRLTPCPYKNCYYLFFGESQASSHLSSQDLIVANHSQRKIILIDYYLSNHRLFYCCLHIVLGVRSKEMNEHL